MITLRLELDGLKEKIVHSMICKQGELEEILRKELDELLTEDFVSKIIRESVQEVFPKAVKDAVNAYFLFGKGRDGIRDAVTEMFIDPLAEETSHQSPS